jgi:peroxiredoxin (alkyl hydroperoxide reductase subunit C)
LNAAAPGPTLSAAGPRCGIRRLTLQERTMLTVGDSFPQFSAQACVGTGKDDIKLVSNKDFAGKWVVYFFYPKDFTFVCPTELAEFNKQLKAFKDRDTSVVGGSTDNEWSHMMWRRSHPDLKDLGYPLVAAQVLAPALGILEKTEGYCLRATFIVDPHGVIQWVDVNQGRVGRNVAEVLRVLDALQSDELCPCNWKKGDPYVKVG